MPKVQCILLLTLTILLPGCVGLSSPEEVFDALQVCISPKASAIKGFGETPRRARSSSFFRIVPYEQMSTIFGPRNEAFYIFGDSDKDLHWIETDAPTRWIKTRLDGYETDTYWSCFPYGYCSFYMKIIEGVYVSYAIPDIEDRDLLLANAAKAANWIADYLKCED